MSQNKVRSSTLRSAAADNASTLPSDALEMPARPSRHGYGVSELRLLSPVLLGVFLMACSSAQAKPKFNASEVAGPCQQLMICDLDGDGLKDLVLMDDTNLSHLLPGSQTRLHSRTATNLASRSPAMSGLGGQTGRAGREFARHDQRRSNRALFYQSNRPSRHPANHPATHDRSECSGSKRRHERDLLSVVGRDGPSPRRSSRRR